MCSAAFWKLPSYLPAIRISAGRQLPQVSTLLFSLSLFFTLSCSSLGRSHSHSLPQAASCRRIVSYIKWLVSMLVSPSLFDSLQCCVGCTHLARLPVWGNMMWQVLFVAAALGRILCGLCCVIVDFMRTRPGPIKSSRPSPSPTLSFPLSLSLLRTCWLPLSAWNASTCPAFCPAPAALAAAAAPLATAGHDRRCWVQDDTQLSTTRRGSSGDTVATTSYSHSHWELAPNRTCFNYVGWSATCGTQIAS